MTDFESKALANGLTVKGSATPGQTTVSLAPTTRQRRLHAGLCLLCAVEAHVKARDRAWFIP
ncbi:hypothetical protein [Aquabacterium sp.]|uniref:hypothetical protein n=1 Tax=Aquabacterium sp. TaxID=1872578 RepID=UPI002487719C|nr:hypothetical protein [Aquabacterium sp.]MDI1260480.1 hypothetical protein [Aquabacterium sp.]